MKSTKSHHAKTGGYALAVTMVLTGVGMMVLASALSWTSEEVQQTQRNNQYYETLYAAEAATEKVVGQINYDFKQGDQANVYNNLNNYRSMVPTVSENPIWSRYTFGDAQGNGGQISVSNVVSWGYSVLQSQYAGLYGLAATYRVMANAHRNDAPHDITVAVQQDVQVATIPIFQFAIFYGMDMEISCGQPFNVTGRVHSNGQLYVCPDNALTFWSDVTAVGDIQFRRAPGDSRSPPSGSVTYKKAHDSRASSMNLPIGTNNTPEAVRAIIEVPPPTEDPNSPMGKQRYYNKADLILKVSDVIVTNTSFSTNITYSTNTVGGKKVVTTNIVISTNITLRTNIIVSGKSGAANNYSTIVPTNFLLNFITLTNSFKDWRESKTVVPIDVDIGKLRTNTALFGALGKPVNQLYVEDARTVSVNTNTQLQAVRLINGATLPTNGLTVATARPLYIQGHYNAPTITEQGTTNTLNTRPASVAADAITILSTAWTDKNSTNSLSARVAAPTTVNAAFLAGIVPTTNYNYYSGGAENFPRFLETWTSQTFTYNGSMVVMFPSRYATSRWGLANVYSPPPRNWAFDLNFMNANKLPPGTPSISTLIRGQWAVVSPRRPSG